MGLLRFLRTRKALRQQRRLLSAIDNSPVHYSDSPGIALENPVVITGAGNDIVGSMAIFAWLIRKRGAQAIEWRVLRKWGRHDGQKHIDIYEIQTRDGVLETFYFDITESFGKWSF